MRDGFLDGVEIVIHDGETSWEETFSVAGCFVGRALGEKPRGVLLVEVTVACSLADVGILAAGTDPLNIYVGLRHGFLGKEKRFPRS